MWFFIVNRPIPAAKIPVSIDGGVGMLETALVTTAAASVPIDLAFPMYQDVLLRIRLLPCRAAMRSTRHLVIWRLQMK